MYLRYYYRNLTSTYINTDLCSARTCIKVIWKTVLIFNDLSRICHWVKKYVLLFSKDDTESRKAFRSMFPDAPTSNETLEAQQDALLRHQEDTLKSMKETSKYRLLLFVFGYIQCTLSMSPLYLCKHIFCFYRMSVYQYTNMYLVSFCSNFVLIRLPVYFTKMGIILKVVSLKWNLCSGGWQSRWRTSVISVGERVWQVGNAQEWSHDTKVKV